MLNRPFSHPLLRTTAFAALVPLALAGSPAAGASTAWLSSAVTVSTYATGFNDPRELKFGPDGHLYVAEGGTGGAESTVGQCTQVPGAGPYTGSHTGGRISKVVNGQRVTVNDHFPSSQTNPQTGSAPSGVADIAWIGGTLYALTAGAGCSHGVSNTVNGIYRVNGSNTPTLVADLSTWEMAHPIAHPDANDFEPDGTWYSMVAVRGALYAVEPNQGQIDRITTSGEITRIVDTSTLGDLQPTAIAYHGNFYVGNLGSFPIQDGSSKIFQVNPGGYIRPVAWGLTTVLGLAFDNRDRMYALEMTVDAPGPTPGHGDIIRIDPSGKQTIILTGLDLPAGMTMGPDGALYVSDWGIGPPGFGKILRISGL